MKTEIIVTIPESIDKVFEAAWGIFSIVNGNPDIHNSSIRFTISLFFLALLYLVIKMRAIETFKYHQLVALVGVVFMMIRESTLLVFMSGWELGIYKDHYVHFVWPPMEHFFEMLAFLCFLWYTVEKSCWKMVRMSIRKYGLYALTSILLFHVYSLYTWKNAFFDSGTEVLRYLEHDVDWQTHLIMTAVALIGMTASSKIKSEPDFLAWFWRITFTEHIIRTTSFIQHFETSTMATIFHAMHTWSIPLIMLHFVKVYVGKMNNCINCVKERENNADFSTNELERSTDSYNHYKLGSSVTNS